MPTNVFKLFVPDSMVRKYAEHEAHGNVPKWDYCKLDKFGQVEEVYCKLCRNRVIGPRDWGDPEVYNSKDEKNTLVVRQRVRVLPFNNYSMLVMVMDDGTQHLTVCCTDCADQYRELSPEVWRDMYVADLASLADTSMDKRDLDVVDKMYNRKPVEVL